MAEIGRWHNHKFEVSPSLIRGFTGLQIKGSSETEDKEINQEKFASRKSAKPTEISLSIHLNALLGCDVRNEAMQFIDDAKAGEKGYFYIGNKKLVTCQMMLTEASISETEITNNGTWVAATVQLTLKQASKNDGTTTAVSTGGGGGGYNPTGAVVGAASALAAAIKAGIQKVKSTITGAKVVSSMGGGGGRTVMCIK